jgi:hypothetical protein
MAMTSVTLAPDAAPTTPLAVLVVAGFIALALVGCRRWSLS